MPGWAELLLGGVTCLIHRSAAEQEVAAENLELGQEDRAAAIAKELDSDVDGLQATVVLPGQERGPGLQVAEHRPEDRRRPSTLVQRKAGSDVGQADVVPAE